MSLVKFEISFNVRYLIISRIFMFFFPWNEFKCTDYILFAQAANHVSLAAFCLK